MGFAVVCNTKKCTKNITHTSAREVASTHRFTLTYFRYFSLRSFSGSSYLQFCSLSFSFVPWAFGLMFFAACRHFHPPQWSLARGQRNHPTLATSLQSHSRTLRTSPSTSPPTFFWGRLRTGGFLIIQYLHTPPTTKSSTISSSP